MSFRQRLLQWIYPLLMRTSKLLDSKNTVLINEKAVKPLQSIFDYNINLNDGNTLQMSSLKGKKIMLVNTASDCGYTAQYEALQNLADRYIDRLIVIAFPANDFKEQEKGNDSEIALFCKKNYGINFPLARKTSVVKGDLQEPIYRWLSKQQLNGWCDQEPEWNFSKYLIDEEGRLISFFPPGISPLDSLVTQHIE